MKACSQTGKEVIGAAHERQKAVWTPRPMAHNGINEAGYRDTVEEIADKSGASNHRSRSDSRTGVSKSELKEPEGHEGHACGLVGAWRVSKEKPVVSDEAIAMAEHESKTKCVEQNAAETRVNDAFHEDVHGFMGAAKAGFEHGEANLH